MEIDAGGKRRSFCRMTFTASLGIRTWNVKDTSRYLQSLFAGHEWTGANPAVENATTLPGPAWLLRLPADTRLDLSYFYSTLSSSALFPNSRHPGARPRRASGTGHRTRRRGSPGRMVPHPVFLPTRAILRRKRPVRYGRAHQGFRVAQINAGRIRRPIYLTTLSVSPPFTKNCLISKGHGKTSRPRSITSNAARPSSKAGQGVKVLTHIFGASARLARTHSEKK